MAARLWTALLMLAAVFAMHGVQCTAAADSAGPAATPAHVGSVAMLALAPGHAHAAAGAALPADPMLAHNAATDGTAGALVDAGHGGAPHDAGSHLWTVCLAVLAAALAVLLAALVPRAVQLTALALVVQSTLLLGCLLAVTAGMAWVLLGVIGLLWTLALGGLVLLLRPRIPPRLVLAMYRAQPLPYDVVPDLHWMVDELTARAGLHYPPALYYVHSPVPNCQSTSTGARESVGRRIVGNVTAAPTSIEVGAAVGRELSPGTARWCPPARRRRRSSR